MGWFAVVSPLHSVGYWFPGTHWWGLVLAILAIMAMGYVAMPLSVTARQVLVLNWRAVGVAALVVLVVGFNVAYTPAALKSESLATWSPVNTALGPYREGLVQARERALAINTQVSTLSTPSTHTMPPLVLVFPETAVGEWRPRTAYWMDESVQATASGQLSWIAGASTPHGEPERPQNGLVVVTQGKATWLLVRVPMPMGMWFPGKFEAQLWNTPVVKLRGIRANLSIC